jgi:type I restriction enzyme M protein
MITGSLKNKINAIWQDFYNENMAQTSDIVNQLTTLMFIKMLDDKQSAIEAQAAIIGIKPDSKDLIFKEGIYQNIEKYIDSEGNEKERVVFEIPYENLRWKNFKNLNSMDLAKTIKNYVIPFIKDPNNKAIGQFGKYAKKYTFGFDDKERLLTAVVDKLSDPELDFNNIDLMGDVYEYMCGSGISGQFRTPRHIIDLAVEMMKPKLGEKIIDPAMGTAGFLIQAAKYIKDNQKNELLNIQNNKKFNDEMFYGSDNDSNMARIAYMNAVLHGIKNPRFSMDSLLENENAKEYIGKFDLVLANPPFKGSLVETATNGKILSIAKTKKTEMLFVALMIMLLKPGGRCMTIVPDGVLENNNEKAYDTLRHELVDKHKLVAVISLPQSLFKAPTKKGSSSKGASIKTSFIIFQKTDKGGTDKVWFYDMKNDGFSLDAKRVEVEENDIPDVIKRFNNLSNEKDRTRNDKSFFVSLEDIKSNNYSLSINTYKEKADEKYEHRKNDDILNELNDLIALEKTLLTLIGGK